MSNIFSSLLDQLPLPLVLIGEDERILHVNPPAVLTIGEGRNGRSYVSAFRNPSLLTCIETVITHQKAEATCTYVSSAAAADVAYTVTARTVDGGRARYVLVIFEDQSAVRDAVQMRRDFVANVSHELKTPLTALLGFVETLRGAAKDDEVARDRFLGTMATEASRMNRLVQDLLSLSRLESEQRIRPSETVDLAAVLRSVVLGLTPIADGLDVKLNLIGTDQSAILHGDQDQLSQVFNNLIENAIKYGGSGSKVDISLTPTDLDPQLRSQAWIATVSDYGDGFDPIHIPRLTERFYRVDGHRSRQMGGTGLGLAIVKHIVTRHRGRLSIDSAPGEGARFSVILPTEA